MNFKFKRNIVKIKEFSIDLLKMAIGTVIMAIGVEQFLLPCQLSTGGFSGIGTVIYYMTGISVGTSMIALNIPLFLIAFFRVGRKFFVKAVLGTILLSYFLNIFQYVNPITTDRFLGFLYEPQ